MIQAIEKMWRRGWREQIKKLNDEFPVGWLDRDTHAPIREEKPPTYCNHEDRTHEVFSSNGETHYLCDKCYKLYLSYAKKEEK
jgi:transposase-like protein